MVALALIASCLVTFTFGADYNVVNLDNATMPLLVGKEMPAFVRFDKDYAHGEKADAFKALAKNAVGARVLIGTVGISTYGEKMNQDLAETYGYKQAGKDLEYSDMEKVFPKFRFFPAAGGASIDYTGEVTLDAMTLYLKKEAKVYFGLKGTTREFDKLAAEFVKSSQKSDVIKRAQSAAQDLQGAEKDAAAYYVKAMEKSQAGTTDWYKTEYDRLGQVMAKSQVAPAKKDEMQLKMNRLSAFVNPNEEL